MIKKLGVSRDNKAQIAIETISLIEKPLGRMAMLQHLSRIARN